MKFCKVVCISCIWMFYTGYHLCLKVDGLEELEELRVSLKNRLFHNLPIEVNLNFCIEMILIQLQNGRKN